MIEEIKEDFLKEKQGIYEAISRDYKDNDLKVDYNQLLDVFNKTSKEDLKKDNKLEVITVVYNGNPYVTLELAINGIVRNKNIVLISEDIMTNLNKKLIEILNNFINNKNLGIIVKWYPDADIDKLSRLDDSNNKIIFLGDKRIYRKLKNNVKIPIIYNGYGSIIIYTDDEDRFEEQIYEIKDYALANNISVNVYNDEISEDLESINNDGRNHICIIFSEDSSKTEFFKQNVRSKNILVNSTKIQDITLEIPNEIWE